MLLWKLRLKLQLRSEKKVTFSSTLGKGLSENIQGGKEIKTQQEIVDSALQNRHIYTAYVFTTVLLTVG